MPVSTETPKRRFTPGLRHLLLLMAGLAVVFALLRPMFQEWGWKAERYIRIKWNEDDLYRHIDQQRAVQFAEELAQLLKQDDDAAVRAVASRDFLEQSRLSSPNTLAARIALRDKPGRLVKGVTGFDDIWKQFVSNYYFQALDAPEGADSVEFTVITEGDRLRLDRVLLKSKVP